MRAITLATAAALLNPASTGGAQVLDSAALFGSEWTANVIVGTADAGPDSVTVKRIFEAHWLAPGRIVYVGTLARNNKRTLFGWVDGRITMLASHADAFSVGNERIRITLVGDQRSRFVVGREFYIGNGDPAYFRGGVYATNGETWRSVAKRGDTLQTDRGPMPVNGAEVAGLTGADPVIQIASNKGFGIVRMTSDGPRILLQQFDTLSDGSFWRYSWPLFPGRFRISGDSWSAVLALKNNTFLAVSGANGPRVVLSDSNRVTPDQHQIGNLQAFPVSADSFLVWAGPNRARNLMLFGGQGGWNVLMPHQDSLRERRGRYYLLRDFHPLGDGSALFSLLYANDYYAMTGHPVNTMFHDVYLIDRGKLSNVPWESELGLTTKQARERIEGPGGGFSSVGEISFRAVPGYDRGVIISLPFYGADFRQSEVYYDKQVRRLAKMPVLRLSGGDSVKLSDVVGWNSPNEAIAFVGGNLAILSRR